MPMAPVRLLTGAGEVPSGKLAGRVGRRVKRDHADVEIRAEPALEVCSKGRGVPWTSVDIHVDTRL